MKRNGILIMVDILGLKNIKLKLDVKDLDIHSRFALLVVIVMRFYLYT